MDALDSGNRPVNYEALELFLHEQIAEVLSTPLLLRITDIEQRTLAKFHTCSRGIPTGTIFIPLPEGTDCSRLGAIFNRTRCDCPSPDQDEEIEQNAILELNASMYQTTADLVNTIRGYLTEGAFVELTVDGLGFITYHNCEEPRRSNLNVLIEVGSIGISFIDDLETNICVCTGIEEDDGSSEDDDPSTSS